MASKRFARVDERRCVSCGTCERECPREAVKVWRGCYAVVDEQLCVGCGACSRACPADCIELVEREVRS